MSQNQEQNQPISIPTQLQSSEFRFIRLEPQSKGPVKGESWKSNMLYHSSQRLQEHIKNGGNYGVVGGPGNLFMLDIDDKDIAVEFLKYFEQNKDKRTFTIKTRSGTNHYYFIAKDTKPVNGVLEGGAGEVRSDMYYVVGPNCSATDSKGFNLGSYTIVYDVPIREIPLKEFEDLIKIYKKKNILNGFDDLKCDLSRSALEFGQVIRLIKEGKNKLQVFYEMQNSPKWNEAHPQYREMTYKKALILAERDGKDSVEDFLSKKDNLIILDKPTVNILPQLCEKLNEKIKGQSAGVYYRLSDQQLVEIVEWEDKVENKTKHIFKAIDHIRVKVIIQNSFEIFKIVEVNGKHTAKSFKLSDGIVKELMVSEVFIDSFPKVNRFFNFPFLKKVDNQPVICHKGYNDSTQSYVNTDLKINYISVDEAKEELNKILTGFCFKSPEDKINALAYLMTPACRGIYTEITARTPIFLIQANRERAGKDYLAGIQGIIYEGCSIDETPFCTGDKNFNNNEELRKKITSSLLNGLRRFHSANNKGNLDNAILEQFTTTQTWKDRILGKNQTVELNNEMDISLSANQGLTFTPDIFNRCINIELFFIEEDPNKRVFPIPNLHGYVKEKRGYILSCIYTLINDWFEHGCPESEDCVFTSFPEWARVVGSIMVFHKMGNPTLKKQSDFTGGDQNTNDMKELFKVIWESRSHLDIDKFPFKIIDVYNYVEQIREYESGLFLNYNLDDRRGKAAFTMMFKNYVGRIFDNIQIVVYKDNDRVNRKEYIIKKIVKNNFEY